MHLEYHHWTLYIYPDIYPKGGMRSDLQNLRIVSASFDHIFKRLEIKYKKILVEKENNSTEME